MIRINGVKMPTPSKYEITIMDISSDDSGRNAAGEMQIDRIATKRKLIMQWNYLNLNDMATLLRLVNDIFFTVEFPDPERGKLSTGTFYVGDRTTPMYSFIKGNPVWQNVAFNLIER